VPDRSGQVLSGNLTYPGRVLGGLTATEEDGLGPFGPGVTSMPHPRAASPG